jgi:type I restriction enzyme S subunit
MDDIAFIDDETHESFKATEIEKNDVFLNITGASIGRSAVADDRVASGNVNQHVCIIRPKADQLDYRFLNHFLLSRSGQKQIDSFQAGGNRQGLNFAQIRSFLLPVPHIVEQRAIASALNDVDALITALDRLIAKKRDIKQDAMQELLTGKRRLPGFGKGKGYMQTDVGAVPEDWKLKSLGDLGEFRNGINKGKEDFGHGFPFVNLMDVFGIPNVFHDVDFGLVNSSAVERKLYDLKRGDVLFVRSSVKPEGVGLTTLVCEDLRDTVFSGFLIRFRDNNQLAINYKEYCFAHSGFRSRLIANSTVSANTNINQEALKALQLAFPTEKKEQCEIATVLSDMDAETSMLETRREKTRALKQGMMQELLTGRIRLVQGGAA